MVEILATAAAVIASLGGGGLLVFALSSWLGKVWANRMMISEQRKHDEALEELRNSLRRRTDAGLEELRHKHSADIDLLVRKRQVYERLAGSMRVFFDRGVPASNAEREQFLQAYDAGFLWADDAVLEVVGAFLDQNVAAGGGPTDPDHSRELQTLYGETMTRMRRDAGFPVSDQARARYRVVSFGDWQK